MTNNENIQVPKEWICEVCKKEIKEGEECACGNSHHTVGKCRGYLFDSPTDVQLLLGYIQSAEAFLPEGDKK